MALWTRVACSMPLGAPGDITINSRLGAPGISGFGSVIMQYDPES
jgi:hypothetical protein